LYVQEKTYGTNATVMKKTAQTKTNIVISKNKIMPMVSDTPYLVTARISRSASRDTPYLFITASPSTVYNEVEQQLATEKGLFKVELVFYSDTGMPIRNEKYFINKADELRVAGSK
jgi:hypothetical protein